MGMKQDIKGNKILLLSLRSGAYRKKMKELVRASTASFKRICYVTFNDPYETLARSIAPGKGSGFLWIDCVSATVKSPKPEHGVTFVSSPHALTEVSIAIKKALEKDKTEFMILDSVSSMLVYEKPLTVLKFIHNIVLTLRTSGIGAAFIILREDVSEEVIKDLNMFVDKVSGVGR